VLARNETGLFSRIVVLSRPFNGFGKAKIVQIFFRHEFPIHPTLQVRFGKVLALVMNVTVLGQALQIPFHCPSTLRQVVQREDTSLWWGNGLAPGAHATARHGQLATTMKQCMGPKPIEGQL
jgi:hypothetical protein